MSAKIYNSGTPATKQYARRDDDGQMFYRVVNEAGHWGRWLESDQRTMPIGSYYDPGQRARLPKVMP